MISRERHVLHPADNLLHDIRAFGALDHQRQLHRRRASSTAVFGVGVLRAVDDVGPLHQVVKVRRLESRSGRARSSRMNIVQD